MSVLAEAIVPSGGDWVSPDMPYAEFRKAGHTFAMRYAVPGIAGKMISRNEVAVAHSHGVDIGLIYETTGATWRGGVTAGKADGIAARQALESLGAPHSVACYHAVDAQVADSEMWVVRDWLTAVAAEMKPYRTGVYGQASVMDMARSLDPSIFRWQTQAWSAGRVSQWTEILQLGSTSFAGINIDIDLAYLSDFGQWYANPAKQPQPQKGDTMITGHVNALETLSIPVPPNSPTYIMLMCDTGLFAGAVQQVRVAIRSKAKGWSQIVNQALHSADSVTIPFDEHDVDAVSLSRNPEDGVAPVGYTIV